VQTISTLLGSTTSYRDGDAVEKAGRNSVMAIR
jgi:hypothetical protein